MKTSKKQFKRMARKENRQIGYHACDIKTIESLSKPVDHFDWLKDYDPALRK